MICTIAMKQPPSPHCLFGAMWGLVTRLCLTLPNPWTVARQAPLSTGFSRQENWSGWPFPSPGGSSQPRDQTRSHALQADKKD